MNRSAEANQRTIREELRKHCISIITRKPFEDSGAIVEGTGANALPEFDFVKAEAQGAYARFFEQAFEWEQMVSFVPHKQANTVLISMDPLTSTEGIRKLRVLLGASFTMGL